MPMREKHETAMHRNGPNINLNLTGHEEQVTILHLGHEKACVKKNFLNADIKLNMLVLNLQESCTIAKMTAQWALYTGALKIFGTP